MIETLIDLAILEYIRQRPLEAEAILAAGEDLKRYVRETADRYMNEVLGLRKDHIAAARGAQSGS